MGQCYWGFVPHLGTELIPGMSGGPHVDPRNNRVLGVSFKGRIVGYRNEVFHSNNLATFASELLNAEWEKL